MLWVRARWTKSAKEDSVHSMEHEHVRQTVGRSLKRLRSHPAVILPYHIPRPAPGALPQPQRHWRKRWQERNVQAAEALKALQSDLRALMCAPGMPGAWEDAPRPQLTRTEVVTERCVGAPPPADGDGEWEEELDENGYMRSDSTKVWKRSVMR